MEGDEAPSEITPRAKSEPFRKSNSAIRISQGAGTLTNGLTLQGVLTSLGELRGDETLQQVLEEVGEPITSKLRDDIEAGQWYPLEWLKQIHQAAQQVTGTGPELSYSLGYEGFVRNLRGPHRFFVSFLRPGHIVRHAPRLFRLYYDRGEVRVLEQGPSLVRVRYEGCTDFDINMWQEQLGSIEAAMESSGAASPRQRVISGGEDDDDHLEVISTWH